MVVLNMHFTISCDGIEKVDGTMFLPSWPKYSHGAYCIVEMRGTSKLC